METFEAVKVIVRVRPLSQKEISSGYKNIINVCDFKKSLTVNNPSASKEEFQKTFFFDAVFGPDSKQLDVYNYVVRNLVDSVLEGYNGTMFAYGQTGTGKTFTMEGLNDVPELRGIIPNSFAHLFGQIAKEEKSKKFLVHVSYLEVYNEEVRDLLARDQTKRLEIKERHDVGVYVKDLSTYVVNNADDMMKIMILGKKNRSVGTTGMNSESSRSHAIFSITVECSERNESGFQHVRMGKLHLVDLAGSERQNKTENSELRFREATKINLSLSTLGNVISALVNKKSTHVPYRNSKLTRLLQDSLGGNAKTIMCANIGPADYNYDETISTLRYATRAKNIRNCVHINEDPKDALLRQFQKEIEQLKKQLNEYPSSPVKINNDFKVNYKSDSNMSEIRLKIENEKKMLLEKKDIEDKEKKKLILQLQEHEDQLRKAKSDRDVLIQKLSMLEKKIIVGGVNLLEKAEEQKYLLEKSAVELEERKRKEAQLQSAIQKQEAERLDIEEKYSSLQEEAIGKTHKLKKLSELLVSSKAELNDLNLEHQREMETLSESIQQFNRELKLQMLIIDHFIPSEYQKIIEQNLHWNESLGEWQLKCIAYTGNNMKRDSGFQRVEQIFDSHDLIYRSYNEVESTRRKLISNVRSARPRTAYPYKR